MAAVVFSFIGAVAGVAGSIVSIWNSLTGLGRVVVLKNHLGHAISLRCQSADDDLGWRTLQHGEAFMFTFGANIFGVTHFWCTVSEKGTAFPLYNEGAPSWPKIVYNLRQEGIYHTDSLDSDVGTWFRGWN